jgi:hypothetical protein
MSSDHQVVDDAAFLVQQYTQSRVKRLQRGDRGRREVVEKVIRAFARDSDHKSTWLDESFGNLLALNHMAHVKEGSSLSRVLVFRRAAFGVEEWHVEASKLAKLGFVLLVQVI